MIPLRDENPTRTTPYVTFVLIAANVVAFLWQMGAIVSGHRAQMLAYTLVPYDVVKGADLIYPGGPQPVLLTVFTSMFMHANFLHIGGNMLYLWIFGNNIEDVLGHFRFLFFFLACGVAAALGQIIVEPLSQIPMMGASGAIAGVLGAYILLFPTANIISLVFLGFFVTTAQIPAIIVLGIWFVTQMVSLGYMRGIGGAPHGGVAYAAHIGGFVAGVILIWLLGGKRRVRQRSNLAPIRRYGSPWN